MEETKRRITKRRRRKKKKKRLYEGLEAAVEGEGDDEGRGHFHWQALLGCFA